MLELKGLEDWARGVLETPISTLNRRFGNWKWEKEEALRDSIEKLPFFTIYRSVFRQISPSLLLELHQKLREQKCEQMFWGVILEKLEHPLPDEIALDLIERFEANDYVIHKLGHSRQSDRVMWKLAPLVDEALLTLARSCYADSERDLSEFEKILKLFPNHEWMFDSVGHCSASSIEKRRAYEKAIENHPKRERWMNTNPNIEPNQPDFSYFDLGRFSYEEQMKLLYGSYSEEKLLEFARGDQTPDEILRDLEELPGSKMVRFNARHTLRRRSEAGE